MKINMRRSFLILVLNALLLTMGAPAMAAPPTEIPLGPNVISAVDPCTGDAHEVTIFFDTFVHFGHPNNFVDRAIRTGFTDSGYELFAGNDMFLENNNVFRFKFKDMWRNDDGRMFRARGVVVINFNTGEVQVEKFAVECVGG